MFSPKGRKVNRWGAGGVNQVDGGSCFTKYTCIKSSHCALQIFYSVINYASVKLEKCFPRIAL